MQADRGPRRARLGELSRQQRFEMREHFRAASPEERQRIRGELFRDMLPQERERFREQMALDREARQRAGRYLESLSEDARRALRGKFGKMSRDERRRLHDQVRAMEPEDRRALRDKLSRFQSLTDTEQQELWDGLAELRSFDAREREFIDRNARRFRENFSESERQKLRGAWQRLKKMEPEERNRILDQLLEDRGPEP